MDQAGSAAAEADTNYLDALEYFDDVGVVELFDDIDVLLGGPAASSAPAHAQDGVPRPDVREERPTEPPGLAAADLGVSDAHDYDQLDIGEVDLRMFRRFWGPRHLLLRDKLAFILGTSLLWVPAYWLGHSPGTFWRLYTFGTLLLLGVRVVLYRRKRWHYYLYDFCYFANMLLMIHVWLLPKSEVLSMVTFGYNSGPLAWSILAFRNSLVFHDLDKVTSLFLHMMPFTVSWALHWYPDTDRFTPMSDGTTWKDLVLLPLLFYCAWAVAYYMKVFVISAAKIERRGYVTLFTYVTTQKRGTFHYLASRIPRRLQPACYLGFHLLFSATTLLLAVVCWYSFVCHTVLLVGIFTHAVWSGATFYFEIFTKKYAHHARRGSTDSVAPQHVGSVQPRDIDTAVDGTAARSVQDGKKVR